MKHFGASATVTLVVITLILLLFPSAVMGVTPSVAPEKDSYLLGEAVHLSGSVSFEANELLPISSVTLTIDGPQPLQATLPVTPGTYGPPDLNVDGLTVTVSWENIAFTYGFGGSYGYGYGYKGLGTPAAINYDIFWVAPIFLDPAPVFSLVPVTEELFAIPQLPPPPEPTPGGPDELPSVTPLFDIPAIQGPQSEAGIAELPSHTLVFDHGLTNPVGLAYDQGTSIFYVLTQGSLTLISNEAAGNAVQNQDNTVSLDNPPGDANGDGFVNSDDVTVKVGTFTVQSWQINEVNVQNQTVTFTCWDFDGCPGGPVTVTYSVLDGADIHKFSAGGVEDANPPFPIDTAIKDAGGLALLNGKFYVPDNTGANNCQANIKIFGTDGSDQGDIPSPMSCGKIGGLGEASDGVNLWATRDAGDEIAKIDSANGQSLASGFFSANSPAGGIVESGETIFLEFSNKVKQFTPDDCCGFQSGPSTTINGLNGNIVGSALKRGDADTKDTMYFMDGSSVRAMALPKDGGSTNNAQAIAYDGTNFWLALDGNSPDKIVKTNADGDLLQEFDAPDGSESVVGLAYLNGFLWVGVNVDCCDSRVYKVDPSTGQSTTDFSVPNVSPIGGLSTNGTHLIATARDFQDVVVFTTSASFQSQPFINGSSLNNGANGIAHQGSDTNKAARAKGSKLELVDAEGENEWQVTQTFNNLTSGGFSLNITGLTFVGDFLYLVDNTNHKVYFAALPEPDVNITTDPKGATTDGANLWVVVDADPVDKILKVSTNPGQILDSFDAPGNNVGAIDYFDGSLFVAVNDFDQQQCCDKSIYEVNPSTGDVLNNAQVPGAFNDIKALANNGNKLIVGMEFDNKIILVNSSLSGQTQEIFPQAQVFNIGWTSFEFALGNLYGASGNQLYKLDLNNNGNTLNTWNLTGSVPNIQGMAYIGTTMYLADTETDVIRGTTFAENTPEATIAGDYTAKLTVTANGSSQDSDLSEFSITKIDAIVATITDPGDGFSVFTPEIIIKGHVNDPSIDTVQVGVDLPFTELFKDSTDSTDSASKYEKTGLWHIVTKNPNDPFFPKVDTPSSSWYYGKDDTHTFNTGGANTGALMLVGPNADKSFPVGSSDTFMEFKTWWDTEPGTQFDRKQVQVSTNGGTSWQTVAMIVPPFDIDQFTGQPFFVAPDLQGQNIQWLGVPPANFAFAGPCPPLCGGFGGGQPVFDLVSVDLGDFQGQDILIRFYFDSVDSGVNDLEGWYIDGVKVGGAGFLGVQVPITPVTDPAQQAQGIFGAFQTDFTLAEGKNDITVAAENPYSTLKGTDSVTGFLDTTAPIVSFDPVKSPTNQPVVTISGKVDDINFDQLVITQETALGKKTIITLKSLPEDKTFEQSASLVEGTNTFSAIATDGAGLEGTAELTVVLDNTGPSLDVLTTTYPIGVQSARQGDPVIFQVNAADEGSGVSHVQIVFPGAGGGSDEVGEMIPAGDLPDAILDLWGTTGEWISPVRVPSNAPPGAFSLTVKAFDHAGNETVGTVEAIVVPTLEAFRFNLMTDWNLLSLPLIPDVTDISDFTSALPEGALEAVWYYDASDTASAPEDRWKVFTPAQGDTDTLTDVRTGRGYWFKTDTSKFEFSEPLGAGLPQTPKPIKLDYEGTFLKPGTLPEVYDVKQGWNLVGFHSENDLPVPTYLRSIEVPAPIWGSLLAYNNRIVFEIPEDPEDEPEFQILLGSFNRILPDGTMSPGFGYWLFMVQDGQIVP